MPDSILLIVFGTLSIFGLAGGVLGFALAMKHAKRPDGELKMAVWAIVGLGGLVVAGMSSAYFLIPILMKRVF
ncbi:MAG: hypothetical protein HY563_08915 [Ignavibacteriales bacterium]|nr:hypothetical protein [Ignavibacteriales bacterium]